MGCRINIMDKRKIVNRHFFIGNNHAGFLVPLRVQYIMVALYQMKIDMWKIISPFDKKFQFLIGLAVKHIANNNQVTGLKILQLTHQPLHIFFIKGCRYCNAFFPEMTGFTKMQVRDHQGSLFFPVNHAFR